MSLSRPKKVIYKIEALGTNEDFYLEDIPCDFGNETQQLYLGMIENKEKVLKHKRAEEYVGSRPSLDLISGRKESVPRSPKRSYDEEFDFSPKRLRREESHASRLDELENKKPRSLGEIQANFANTEKESSDEKRFLMAKFEMITRTNPEVKLPYVTMSTDLQFMKDEYENAMRRIGITKSHQWYRQMLGLSFFGIEWLLGHFFKMNMKDYTKSQLDKINMYDSYLLEISHKNYVPNAPERFPVEVRLLGMIVLNTAFFVLCQNLAKSITSGNFGTMLSMMDIISTGQLPNGPRDQFPQPLQPLQAEEKKLFTAQGSRMRGPPKETNDNPINVSAKENNTNPTVSTS